MRITISYSWAASSIDGAAQHDADKQLMNKYLTEAYIVQTATTRLEPIPSRQTK